MDFGLLPRDLDEIVHFIQQFPAIEKAIIFGSRAKGNYKKGSDVDIAIQGRGIDSSIVSSLSFLLNEDSSMPYSFDIVHFEGITESALEDHINRVGQQIFLRE